MILYTIAFLVKEPQENVPAYSTNLAGVIATWVVDANFFIAVLALFLIACIEHHSVNEFDVVKLELESAKLLESNKLFGIIWEHKLPLYIAELKPHSVRTDVTGVFINLNTSFVSESGLFVPRSGFKPPVEQGTDPRFKHLQSKVYSYVIKG